MKPYIQNNHQLRSVSHYLSVSGSQGLQSQRRWRLCWLLREDPEAFPSSVGKITSLQCVPGLPQGLLSDGSVHNSSPGRRPGSILGQTT